VPGDGDNSSLTPGELRGWETSVRNLEKTKPGHYIFFILQNYDKKMKCRVLGKIVNTEFV
jgi:hypothetical protein